MVGLRDVFVFHQHDQILSDPHATALGIGVIPLLTAAPCLAPLQSDDGRNNNGGIQFWQNQNQTNQNHYHSHFLKNKTVIDSVNAGNLLQNHHNPLSSAAATSIATATCQDCGNQSKKDCTNRRCRTCCKSRGFDCPTHVKSTWVPAARRRERQLMGVTSAVGSSSSSVVKKPRLVASQTTTTSHTSTSNTSDASFKESLPGEIRAPAVFKCVRVTAVEEGEDEYAYQGMVKIGGHVFRGFLYDQGLVSKDGFPNISELNLGGGGGDARRNGGSSSAPIIDPVGDVYGGSSGGGLLGGSEYGTQIT